MKSERRQPRGKDKGLHGLPVRGHVGVRHSCRPIIRSVRGLVDSDKWNASVAALLADMPKFQANVRLMMSGLINE